MAVSDKWIKQTATFLEKEIRWLNSIIEARFNLYFAPDEEHQPIQAITPPALGKNRSEFASLIRDWDLGFAERVLLAIAAASAIRPESLDVFFTRNKVFDRGFTEFGGRLKNEQNGFVPTVNTVLFLLAGANIGERLQAKMLFSDDHPLIQQGVITLKYEGDGQKDDAMLQLSPRFYSLLLEGKSYQPTLSHEFPAELLNTQLEWEDLALEEYVHKELQEVLLWIEHGSEIMDEWDLARHVKPGYRSLFYGPPGTGKTLTAVLLGKRTNRHVFRVDLSKVVSKYIGETEKNLARLFDAAENQDWILFFDEADSLYGKRTKLSSSNDRHANQEVSYLLQRIESFHGIVILASNFRGNLDDAFTRRLQSIIHFPVPGEDLRLQIWKSAFPSILEFEKGIDFVEIARKHVMTGGSIVNVVRYCAVCARGRGETLVYRTDLDYAIRRELQKSGKSVH